MKSIICVCAILLSLTSANAQGFLYPGEDLTYRVSYAGITLGTVRAVTEPFTTLNGRNVAKVKVFINSSSGIPFVSLHSTYQSWMDSTAMFSHLFNASTQVEGNLWEFDQYVFDYTKMNVVMETSRDKRVIKRKETAINKYCNDGSSLLYTARTLLNAKKTITLPTVVMGNLVSTVINFRGKKEAVDIDAVNYPVKTTYFDGVANWTGIYGLSGNFEGWFSDDAARVPIKAKMKVYVGSVTIELQSWKRGSWQPPKAS
jgi:hypothetical protein